MTSVLGGRDAAITGLPVRERGRKKVIEGIPLYGLTETQAIH